MARNLGRRTLDDCTNSTTPLARDRSDAVPPDESQRSEVGFSATASDPDWRTDTSPTPINRVRSSDGSGRYVPLVCCLTSRTPCVSPRKFRPNCSSERNTNRPPNGIYGSKSQSQFALNVRSNPTVLHGLSTTTNEVYGEERQNKNGYGLRMRCRLMNLRPRQQNG